MNIPVISTSNSNTLQEKYNRKHYPEFCQYLDQNYPEDISFKEKLYWYFHEINDYPTCPICGNRVRFVTYGEGYKKHCSSGCVSKDQETKIKFKQTCIEKYGVDNPSKTPEVLQKIRNTNIERYGVEYHSQLEEAKEKTRQTNIERYGGSAPMCSEKVQEKTKLTLKEKYGDENYNNRDKCKQTCIEKYGTDNPLKNKEILEKSKKTCLERYGVDNSFKSKEIRKKSQATKLKKYGDPFFTNTKKAQQTKLEKYGDPFFTNHEKSKQTCLEKYGVDHPMKVEEHRQKLIGRTNQSTLDKYNEIIGWGKEEYICSCPHIDCNNCQEKQYTINRYTFLNRKYQGLETCTHLLSEDNCHNRNTTIEIFIQNILDFYNIQYETNNRKILKGKELDIYIPSRNLAIECNGIFWHSQYSDKDNEYHYNKWKCCQDSDIQLLTFWEDQILHKPEIVKSMVLSKLGIYQKRIGASKCSIKKVAYKEAQAFLEENHLQGNANGSIRIGLYYKNQLVSIMTFGKKRISVGSKNTNDSDWELYRYCTLKNWQIIGGAERLLKHFIKQYNPNSIVSFSSNDISNGILYKNLDFTKINQSISYWYIDKTMKRYHRYQFRKSELIKKGYDPNKTEKEITEEMNLYRIFDSGQIKWIWTPKSSL